MTLKAMPPRHAPSDYSLDSPSRSAVPIRADPSELPRLMSLPGGPHPSFWVRLSNAARVFRAIWRSEKPKRRWLLQELRSINGEAASRVSHWLLRRIWIAVTLVAIPALLGFGYYTFTAELPTWLDQMDHVGSIMGGFAVTAAATRYLLSRSDARRQDQWRAWEVITAAQGKAGNGGRLDAVLALANDGVELDGINLDGAYLSGIRLPWGASLRNAKLRPVDGVPAVLAGAHAVGVNLDGAELPDACFEDSNLEQSSLSYTDLRQTIFRRARLADAMLHEADLSKSELQEADLRRIHAIGAWFCSAELFKANCVGALFSGADLRFASFSDAVLSHADFAGAHCQQTEFRSADLRWASFDRADMEEAVLFQARAQETVFRGARLQGANLRKAKLEGADLSGAFLQGACFEDASWDHRTKVVDANVLGIKWSEPFRQWALANGAIARYDAPDYMLPVVGYVFKSDILSAVDAHLHQGKLAEPTRSAWPLSATPAQTFLVGESQLDRAQVQQWADGLNPSVVRYEILREGQDAVRIKLSVSGGT